MKDNYRPSQIAFTYILNNIAHLYFYRIEKHNEHAARHCKDELALTNNGFIVPPDLDRPTLQKLGRYKVTALPSIKKSSELTKKSMLLVYALGYHDIDSIIEVVKSSRSFQQKAVKVDDEERLERILQRDVSVMLQHYSFKLKHYFKKHGISSRVKRIDPSNPSNRFQYEGYDTFVRETPVDFCLLIKTKDIPRLTKLALREINLCHSFMFREKISVLRACKSESQINSQPVKFKKLNSI